MRNVQIEKQFLLSQPDLYPDVEMNPSKLLSTVPQTHALEFISYLLHLYNVRKRDDGDFQSRHLIQWMMQMDNADKARISNFIQLNQQLVFDPSFKVINRRPSLNLIQHILIHCPPGSELLNSVHYSALFKCILYFNLLENQVQEQLLNWDGIGDTEQFANIIIVAQVRNIEHERFKDYVIQFLKVYYFFVFLESHSKYAGYLKMFLAHRGLTSYTGYLWNLMNPFLRLLTNDTPTPKMHIDDAGKALHFYQQLAINGKITSTDKDYKPLRQYPLFESDAQTYTFMDYRFFVDKFFQGFLFDFTTTVKISYGSLKADMGNEFSEHILFYAVMKRCFGGYGIIRLTGDEIKSMIGEGEPDYYIRKGTAIFLFEFKDAVLSAEIKYCGDAAKIKAGITEKLEKNSLGKRKGITQLLYTIKSIYSGLYRDKNVDYVNVKNIAIYPIIVHTDITLESYGVNYFLNKRMAELADDTAIKNVSIKNLVMINLDTLIKLQDHFADGKLELEGSITAYISYISSDDPKTATFPFDEFVKYYFTEQNKEDLGNPRDFNRIITSFAS